MQQSYIYYAVAEIALAAGLRDLSLLNFKVKNFLIIS